MGSDGSGHLGHEEIRSFNSRSRVGSDRIPRLKPSGSNGFNSRSRVGSDFSQATLLPMMREFQFTLPRGERRITINVDKMLMVFQFTLPRGERPDSVY